jgi:hypothetical protein
MQIPMLVILMPKKGLMLLYLKIKELLQPQAIQLV